MGQAPVEIVEFDSNWKFEFQKIKDMLNRYIGDLVLGIEHVGSTSIEGLCAKPIIDVDVVIDTIEVLPQIIERLKVEGFVHEGNLGVEDREAFKRTYDDGMMKYHLYVCPRNGKALREHIAFRDYLKTNDKAREEYGQLKMRLAQEFRNNREEYTNHKTDFVKGILDKTIYR